MRNCPCCHQQFSNWHLFKVFQGFPSFRCPGCRELLTHNKHSQFRADGGVITLLALLFYREFPEPYILLGVVAILVAYEYFWLKRLEIIVFDERQKQKCKSFMRLPVGYSPFIGWLSIVASGLLFLFSVIAFLIVDLSSFDDFLFVVILFLFAFAFAGSWVGCRLLNKSVND